MKKVIQLIRVSTSEQAGDDRGGIPAQKLANRCTAATHNLEIVETVEMIDVSGTAVLAAPQMQHLLQRIGEPGIHGVVAREFSRLMRPQNLADFAILQSFIDTNTLLYTPEQVYDFADPHQSFVGIVQAGIARMELSTIKKRMMSGKEALRRAGRWASGSSCLPFGVDYDRPTNKFFYKPEAAKVQELFQRFLAGEHNYQQLTAVLGSQKLRGGKLVHTAASTIRYILSNPIYTGWLVFREKCDLSPAGKRSMKESKPIKYRRMTQRSAEEAHTHRVIEPGLITQGDFDRVQALIATKQELCLRQRQKVGEFTYNGFLWCAQCGGRLHSYRSQADSFYYVCANKKRRMKDAEGNLRCSGTKYMKRNRLELYLDGLVMRTLLDPKVLKSIYEGHKQLMKAQRGVKKDPALLQSNLESLQRKRERVIESYVDGILDKPQRDNRLQVINREIGQAQADIAERDPIPQWTPELLATVFAPFHNWEFLDREEKRRLLSTVAPRFLIEDYKIRGLLLGVVGKTISASAEETADRKDRDRPNILRQDHLRMVHV